MTQPLIETVTQAVNEYRTDPVRSRQLEDKNMDRGIAEMAMHKIAHHYGFGNFSQFDKWMQQHKPETMAEGITRVGLEMNHSYMKGRG